MYTPVLFCPTLNNICILSKYRNIRGHICINVRNNEKLQQQ